MNAHVTNLESADRLHSLHAALCTFREEVVRQHDKSNWAFLLETAIEMIDIAAHDLTHAPTLQRDDRLHQAVITIEQVIRDADEAGAIRA